MKVERDSPGKASATTTETLTATVEAIDLATRSITLSSPDGLAGTFEVDPQVKRLNEIAVGDRVEVVYRHGLFLAMQEPGASDVAPELSAVAVKAGKDQKPGGGAVADVRATVVVDSIDPKTRIVTLKGPAGGLHRVEAGPSVKLERLKVGDKIVATYTEAVAVSVKPAKKD